MSKLDGRTLDIEEQNIKRIKELFPEVDIGGKIDFEKLKQVLGEYVDDSEERYKFTWNGKGEALRLSQTPSIGTLRPVPEEGESKDWHSTENLYIEGDNLEVLKLLQKSYFGKIKMIYIDPPYNTGNDFVYKDNYKDNINNYKKITGQVDAEGNNVTTNPEYSGRYHTDWLNMMYPRLRLARNLLTEHGVIFISIDDNEVHNLRKICDEVFGEDNFLASVIWNSTKSVTNTALISVSHTYNLIYFKNMNYYTKNRSEFRLPDTGEGFSNPDNDPRGPWKADPFQVGGWRPNQQYEIINPITGASYKPNTDCSWKNDYKRYLELVEDNRIVFGISGEAGPQRKRFLFEAKERGRVSKTLWDDIETTTNGTQLLKKIFDDKIIFNNPKPIELLERMLTLGTRQNDIILDFFAGSSTTAHGVMNLNAEDNGNRKFIMVQLPEPTDEKSEAYKAGYKNIAEIGKERIRRAGDKIKSELEANYEKATEEERKNMKNPDKLDIGFKVFKLDSSNIKEWNPGKYENIQLAIEDSSNPYVEGRTEEDIVYEMMLKMGLDLTSPVERYEVNGKLVYSIDCGLLMICLSDNIDLSIAEKMIEITNKYNQNKFRTIFRDEGFNSDKDKTNIKETLKSAGLAEESFITL